MLSKKLKSEVSVAKMWLSWMFGALGKEKVKFERGSSMQLAVNFKVPHN